MPAILPLLAQKEISAHLAGLLDIQTSYTVFMRYPLAQSRSRLWWTLLTLMWSLLTHVSMIMCRSAKLSFPSLIWIMDIIRSHINLRVLPFQHVLLIKWETKGKLPLGLELVLNLILPCGCCLLRIWTGSSICWYLVTKTLVINHNYNLLLVCCTFYK